MYWANFLHIYQPPTQKAFWINKIAAESYKKITEGLLKNPNAKVTLNINAILTEHLIENGWQSIIDDIIKLAKRGQVEFTETAKFHPFLPLLPASEIKRQVELNHKTNKKVFGDVYNPKGFFPTEMGWNEKIAKVVSDMGYSWVIIAELAFPKGEPKNDVVYYHKKYKKLNVFFRDGDISFRLLSAQVGVSLENTNMLKDFMGDNVKKNHAYMITAVDGETFGHHRPGLEELLFDMYKSNLLKSVTISEIVDLFDKREPILARASTWALLKKDLHKKNPYTRWYSEKNEIHMAQWKLTDLAIKLIKKYPQKKPRLLLDRAVHSDQYWWASAQPWWSIEMIEAGAKDLVETIDSFKNIPKKFKEQAHTLYQEIVYTSFDWQRSDKIANLAKEADEDVTQRITKELPYIPIKEFNEIVKNLERQMLHAAKDKEYERAAQLRDRITELNDKKNILTKKR